MVLDMGIFDSDWTLKTSTLLSMVVNFLLLVITATDKKINPELISSFSSSSAQSSAVSFSIKSWCTHAIWLKPWQIEMSLFNHSSLKSFPPHVSSFHLCMIYMHSTLKNLYWQLYSRNIFNFFGSLLHQLFKSWKIIYKMTLTENFMNSKFRWVQIQTVSRRLLAWNNEVFQGKFHRKLPKTW